MKLVRGTLLVNKAWRGVYVVRDILPNGNVVLEADDDGSISNDDDPVGDGSPAEVLTRYEVWRPGLVICDRTGKGSFCGKPNGWQSFLGVPPPEVETRVLDEQSRLGAIEVLE